MWIGLKYAILTLLLKLNPQKILIRRTFFVTWASPVCRLCIPKSTVNRWRRPNNADTQWAAVRILFGAIKDPPHKNLPLNLSAAYIKTARLNVFDGLLFWWWMYKFYTINGQEFGLASLPPTMRCPSLLALLAGPTPQLGVCLKGSIYSSMESSS